MCAIGLLANYFPVCLASNDCGLVVKWIPNLHCAAQVCWRCPGKIDLYVGKEVVRRAIPMESACDQLVELIKVRRFDVMPHWGPTL